MKMKLINGANQITKSIALFVSMLMLAVYSVSAQDKKVDVNINSGGDSGGSFWGQPWVWIVGGAVFLLLLVALLRNNNSKA